MEAISNEFNSTAVEVRIWTNKYSLKVYMGTISDSYSNLDVV